MGSSPRSPARYLAAIWFADLVGYSRLASEDEPAALRLVELLQRTALEVVEAFSGRLVKSAGDAVLAEFSSTGSAVECALSLQRAFGLASEAHGQPATLRVGVHVGEVTRAPDGDIYGDGVNVAARLQTAAEPAQVVVSGEVWRQLQSQPLFSFQVLGEHTLKGIRAPVALFAVEVDVASLASIRPPAWAFDITPDGVERTDARDQPQSGEHPANQLSPRGNQRTSGPSRKPYPRRNRSVPVPDGSGATESQPPDPARVKRASLAYLWHEIRTPVNAIMGYSEMLLEDATAPEQQDLAADLQKIHTAGKQILSIVDDILHPEKIALAKTDEDPHAFRVQLRHALRTPLNAVIGYSEMLIEGGRETNRKDLLPDLQRILDAARHVLGLVNDIVQLSATDTGGQGENARFAAGSVMAQEVLAKIRPLAAGPRRDPEIQEGCLLVVDDNDMNRNLLARQLARGGYSVRAARNGREALEMVRVQDFDLILLDIMMPELDGFEVLRQLKSDTMLRDIPVIMISALDEIDSVIRCVEMGAEDYLSKPFDPVLLKARVGANLEVRHMRDRERTYAEQLSLEQEFADRLLLSVFPSSIAERFRAGENKIADFFPEATALWAELDGPPRSAARSSATDVLGRLGEMWSVFDQDARQLGLETFEVAGHTCLIAGGVPTPREDHADAVAEMAVRMLDATQQYEAKTGEPLQIRVGIHTGSIFAGVVGTARLTYGLWGDAIHTARHLNAHGDSGAILVSPATYIRLRDRYHFQNKGVVEIAGKGQMLTYVLQGRAEPSRVQSDPGFW